MKLFQTAIFLFMGCVPVTDPDKLIGDSDRPVDPGVEDFQSSQAENDLVLGGDTGDDPEPLRSILQISLEGLVLTVNHDDLTLDCAAVFINELSFEDNEITVTYTETPLSSPCNFQLTYKVNVEELAPGPYTFTAEGDSESFEIPE
jgi:hypothetical protein